MEFCSDEFVNDKLQDLKKDINKVISSKVSMCIFVGVSSSKVVPVVGVMFIVRLDDNG